MMSFVERLKLINNKTLDNNCLQQVKIISSALAEELEAKSSSEDKSLLYSQFSAVEQFGEHGYHAMHKKHGETQLYKDWGKAIVAICQKKGLKRVVEFGSGDGALGEEILKESNKEYGLLSWHGVEINEFLVKQVEMKFAKYKLKNWRVTQGIGDELFEEPSLYVFGYFFDSIPPEIVVCSKDNSYPDSVLGISIENKFLSECILNREKLEGYNYSFSNGIFRDKNGIKFDLSKWELSRGQRVYLPVKGWKMFFDIFQKAAYNSVFLIIDEFSYSRTKEDTEHLALPRNLYGYPRSMLDISRAYAEAGKHHWYFPFYLSSWIELWKSLGIGYEAVDIDQRLARHLINEKWVSRNGSYLTVAMLSEPKKVKSPSKVTVKLPLPTIEYNSWKTLTW